MIERWLMSLSTEYNLNPYFFTVIYVGAIPFSAALTLVKENYSTCSFR